MPPEDGVGSDDGSDIHERPASEGLSPHRKPPPLGIGQPESSATELLLEDAILLPQIRDGGFLLSRDPAGHRGNENLPGLKNGGHPAIVAWGPGIGQLSERRADRVELP